VKTVHNVVANVGGRLWQTLMSFIFIPLYVRYLGVEAYGLIGVFATILAVLTLLDLGLSLTVNREMARLDAQGKREDARTLVRTLEVVYWSVGLLAAITIFLCAGTITRHWLNLSRLPESTATAAIQLMAVVSFLRWPGALYSGVLMGLREHVTLNLIAASAATLTGVGAVIVLWLLSPTVTAFFGWQIVAAAINIVLLVHASWRKLSSTEGRARFDPAMLKTIFRFSAGVFGVTVLSVVLMQLDKLVISSSLTLTSFGYYTLAFVIANILPGVGVAVQQALFPSLSQIVATDSEEAVANFYHKSCQVMALTAIPAGMMLAFFAPELLLLYLGNLGTMEQVRPLVVLFAVGNTLYCLMMMPYALQLAYGWTRLSIYKNIAAVLLYVPLLLVLVHFYGSVGAPISWLVLMCGYFVLEIGFMHARLLRGQMSGWYGRDVIVPWIIVATCLGLGRLIAQPELPLLARLAVGLLATAFAAVAIVMSLPHLRDTARQLVASLSVRTAGFGQQT
jgi:O-antigen/teichoic acid export membrane protein